MNFGKCSESLVTGETILFYVWIIRMMSEMKPRWKLSRIKLICYDNFITDEHICELGILDICILRCDLYHVLSEVCISNISFGEIYLTQIQLQLLQMLDSSTRKIWNNGYNRVLIYYKIVEGQ